MTRSSVYNSFDTNNTNFDTVSCRGVFYLFWLGLIIGSTVGVAVMCVVQGCSGRNSKK